MAAVDPRKVIHVDQNQGQRQAFASSSVQHEAGLVLDGLAQRQAGQAVFWCVCGSLADFFVTAGHQDRYEKNGGTYGDQPRKQHMWAGFLCKAAQPGSVQGEVAAYEQNACDAKASTQ